MLCRRVPSTTRHDARCHLSDNISTTSRANLIRLLRACSWRCCLSYGAGDSP
jgi:hypothetical protein